MILSGLESANLKIKPEKCHLFQKELHYLGHVISAKGVQPNPLRVETVVNWQHPVNKTDLRAFLGLANLLKGLCR